MGGRNDEHAMRQQHVVDDTRRKLPPGVKLVRTLEGHGGLVTSLAFEPQGTVLASGSRDRTVRLWAVGSGELIATLKEHPGGFMSVAFDPKGEILACGGDSTLMLWDARSGKLLRKLEGHRGQITSVAFSPQSGMLASGGDDNTVRVWNAGTGQLLYTFTHHTAMLRTMAFAPQSGALASGSDDGTLNFWEIGGDRLPQTLRGHDGHITKVAYHPHGETLVSGGQDKTIKLWEARSGKLLRTLEGHTDWIDSLTFTPDGRLLASKSGDGTIRLWNCERWEPAAIIPEPTDASKWAPALTFHPTLPLLASVGSGLRSLAADRCRYIHFWELDFDILLGKAAAPTVTYTSAKVVLVGESNVGKSYLAHRIATGEAPQPGTIGSTHGMKFWPLVPKQLDPALSAPPKERSLCSGFDEKLFGRDAATGKTQRRDVVLWDMGGQEEYRLVHQLFLHDTTVALVLVDPTRGTTSFKEVEAWNKSLDKQLRGRAAVKLLVGAKMDEPSEMIDRQALERLCRECGFAGYCETSALNARGIVELCDALANAINWDELGKTSRPELFQRIRDEIEVRRKRGEVVVSLGQLVLALSAEQWTDEEEAAVNAVTEQLAAQGLIARSKFSTGEPVLVLQVQEIERYAGSLILAAKISQRDRGVPALELRALAQEHFHFPQIAANERLAHAEEKSVVECTVQLMLEHGICFQHEGLLVFPSLFASATATPDEKLPHAVSLYYDFAGAIDNIYASLVAWLVLAKEFGKVRLWADRAEFELESGGLCGLRKVGRAGGFAHVDVYFEKETPPQKQSEFISFVEDHLARNGVEIREHVAITCPCGHAFAEETLRLRIARGDKDVVCPVCETRHNLSEGAAVARERDAKIARHTWALRTEIEKAREKITRRVVRVLDRAGKTELSDRALRLLHLSDLHFTVETPVEARLQWLLDDLKLKGGLGFNELDYLVVSGDFTDKGNIAGFEKAYDFVSGLTREFGLSAERCIFVPGNHDVCNLREAYEWRETADGLKDGEWVKKGDIILARNAEKYPQRLKAFSDAFHHKFLQRPYPLDCAAQGCTIPFWETGLQFLTLNSCWQIDQFHPKRSSLHAEAVAHAIKQAQKQEDEARYTGKLAGGRALLRIAVWHHAVAGPEQMMDTDLLGNLQKSGVRLALHGDVHEMQREQVGHRHHKAIHVVGSGSFGARSEARPEATPRLYNVLEIARDLKSVRVHTRCQAKPDGPWDGWHEWENPKDVGGRVAFYDITF